MMIAPEPAIRLHGSGQRRERGQRWERLERRLIAACLPLVGTLMIVMMLELLSDTLDLFQTLRPMDVEALFFVASMISLDMSIFVWLMWRAQARFDLDTEQKASQRRGKIPTTGPPYPARVVVKGHLFGATMLA
jgi:hypothetical protein